MAAPVAQGVWPVAAAAVVAVVVGIAVYLRWVAVLLGSPGHEAAPDAAPAVARTGRRSSVVVLVLGTAVLVLTSALPHALLAALG